MTYGIKNIDDYNFSGATLNLYYDNLQYGNESALRLHKCINWNFTAQTCIDDINDITDQATHNILDNRFEYNTTSFSGFFIREIVASPTTNSLGSGGGCLTSWACTDWSACLNGQEVRTCTKETAHCYAQQHPVLNRSCAITPSALPFILYPLTPPLPTIFYPKDDIAEDNDVVLIGNEITGSTIQNPKLMDQNTNSLLLWGVILTLIFAIGMFYYRKRTVLF